MKTMSWREIRKELAVRPEMAQEASASEARVALAISVNRLRTERAWTQSELAKRVGTGQPNISEIECGDANPTLETLTRLATVFGVGVDRLLRRETDETRASDLVGRYDGTRPPI
jgi:DNA-binding XRE family transcriptional regulator